MRRLRMLVDVEVADDADDDAVTDWILDVLTTEPSTPYNPHGVGITYPAEP